MIFKRKNCGEKFDILKKKIINNLNKFMVVVYFVHSCECEDLDLIEKDV